MATILLTWELGGGIGHMMNLRPIGMELARRGHRVFAALQDTSKAAGIFADTGVTVFAGPKIPRRTTIPFERPLGFAHILGNVGFSEPETLAAMFAAWNAVFDDVQPALVITDYSPFALMALRGRNIRCVNVGIGFFCPPDVFPMPFWAPPKRAGAAGAQVARDETQLIANVNRVLEGHGRPRIERLAQLFNEIDEVVLATYPELDHYGARPGVRYWGHWPYGPGVEPVWPAGVGKKVYVYPKQWPVLGPLLGLLAQMGNPTLIYSGSIDAALEQKYATTNLRFERQPLDIRKVAAECELAILHAGHGTTAAMMLAEKPCLLIPTYLEQFLFASKVECIGAGTIVSPNMNVNYSVPLATKISSIAFAVAQRGGSTAKFARSANLFEISNLADFIAAILP